MLDNFEKERFYNSIITWAPDRLTRNMKEAGELMDLIKKGKIYDLKFPEFPFQKDEVGMLFLGIAFIGAENYSASLSKTTKRGIDVKVETGKGIRGDEIFGYKLEKDRYVPDHPNFEIVKNAFQLVLDGRSLREIADISNTEALTRGKKSYELNDKKLSLILRNPFYVGIWVRGDNIVSMV